MAAVATYAAQLVQVVFQGNTITGYGDGDFCKISRDEDAFHKVVGADGIASRSRNGNLGGSVEITIQSTSPSNGVLSTIAELDEVVGTSVGSCFVKDVGGTTLWSAQNAWIKKRPEVTFAKEQNTRVWVIDCDALIGHVGGNPV